MFFVVWFIVDDLMRKGNKNLICLLKVDLFDIMKEIDDVLKFVCELLIDVVCFVFSYL